MVKTNTGVVMQLERKHAFIMTGSGEFLKIKIGKAVPSLGEIYTGESVNETPFFKYAATAASLAFILCFGGVAKAYYTPVSTVDVNINPSVQLQLNRWDKIIKTLPLNDDGKKVLDGLNIKNKALNDGLDLIVEEAKKDNFINENYIESGKTIHVSISTNKPGKDFDLSQFEEYTKKSNLNVKINKPVDELDSKDNKSKNNVDGNGNKNNDAITNENNKSTESDKNNNKSTNGNSNKNNEKKNGESKATDQNINNNTNSQEKKSNSNNQRNIEQKGSESKEKNKNKK